MSEYDGHIVEGHDGKHYDRTNTEKYKGSVSDKVNEENLNKECVKCGTSYLNTAEYFYRDKYRKGGLMPICKECKKKKYQEKKANLKKKDLIIINPEGIEVEVKISDEEKLLKFAKEFINFLKSNPKIRFNLHNSLETIHKKLKYIQRQIYN